MTAAGDTWTLAAVWEALRKFWGLIVGLTLLAGGIGYAISASEAPQYRATAALYFALDQGTTGSDLNQGSAYTQNQMLSFAQIATSSRVLAPVIDELGLETTPRRLAGSIAITIPQDTSILEMTATSSSPERAADVANALADELIAVVQEVAAQTVEDGARITASVIDDAVPPEFQSSPDKTRDALLAAVLGFLAGVLAALVATIGDTRVRNEEAVARVTDVPVLGVIARTRRGVAPSLIAAREPHSRGAEDVRRVQSALAFATLDLTSRRILVSSATPGEGKSTFASNLAVTLAELGERTLVIDADLRRPMLHELFGVDGTVGLTTALMGSVGLDEAIHPWREGGPDLLTSGTLPPNPASIVTSEAFRSLLDAASARYDAVVIDSPPVLTVADANLLARLVDGVVLVVDASRTRRPQLANTLRSVESSGGRVLGIVLNKARDAHRRDPYLDYAPRDPVARD